MRVFIREGWTNRETGKKGDPRMQFNNFMQLQDVMETFSKKLTINLDLQEVQGDRIEQLRETLFNHRGDHNLHFYVFEPNEKIALQMPSRKKKVKISSALLNELKAQQFSFKLN